MLELHVHSICHMSILMTIGLIYSVIAPLILIFSIFCFWALWMLCRYNPPQLSKSPCPTGIFYPTAICQLYTGLYFIELCLIGHFFLVRDSENRITCKGQGIIMIFVLIVTAVFQYLGGWKASWKLLPDASKIDDVKHSKSDEKTGQLRIILRDASQRHGHMAQDACLKSAPSII